MSCGNSPLKEWIVFVYETALSMLVEVSLRKVEKQSQHERLSSVE